MTDTLRFPLIATPIVPSPTQTYTYTYTHTQIVFPVHIASNLTMLFFCTTPLVVLYYIFALVEFDRAYYERTPELSMWSNTQCHSSNCVDEYTHANNIIILLNGLIVCILCGLSVMNFKKKITEKIGIVILFCLGIIHVMIVVLLVGLILKYTFGKLTPSFFYMCNYGGFRDYVENRTQTQSQYETSTNPLVLIDKSKCEDKEILDYIQLLYSFPSVTITELIGTYTYLGTVICSIMYPMTMSSMLGNSFKTHTHVSGSIILCVMVLVGVICASCVVFDAIHKYITDETDVIGSICIGVGIGYFCGNFAVDGYFKYMAESWEVRENERVAEQEMSSCRMVNV